MPEFSCTCSAFPSAPLAKCGVRLFKVSLINWGSEPSLGQNWVNVEKQSCKEFNLENELMQLNPENHSDVLLGESIWNQ